ncbi:MAG: response regulator [Deltaproteobacteria bacterium]|nr:response regulator [Deltaproteobacteria bacterium]
MASILVVDDDRNILDTFVDLFNEHGYTVETCRDGKQALEHLRSGAFDLLLLDVLIPNINGFLLVEQMNEDESLKKIPVIVFSGIYRSINHRQDLVHYEQVIEYLDKPLQTERVVELATKILGKEEKIDDSALDGGNGGTFIDGILTSSSFNIADVELPVDTDTEHEADEVEQQARTDFRRRNRDLALQGSLENHSIAEVLGKLWNERASGALLLRSGKVKKIVYVKDGTACGVKSNLVGECLGQLLVQERMISREDLQQSITKMKETGAKQGQILVEMGSITESNLSYALGLQLETKIFEPFTWETGEYRFNPSVELPEPTITIDFQEGALIVEGIHRAFDEKRLRFFMSRFMESRFDYPNAERKDLTHLQLPESLSQKLKESDFPASPRELTDEIEGDVASLLGVIYAMISLRILKPLPN